MRLTVLAVGFARNTSQGALVEDYIHRALLMGRNMGFSSVVVEEIFLSKARDAKTRMAEEAEKLAAQVPAGAHIILLDAKGKGMTSEDFAEMLGALRDAAPRIYASSSAGRTASPRCRANARVAVSPSGRRPGRIFWCARCWPNRSIAR